MDFLTFYGFARHALNMKDMGADRGAILRSGAGGEKMDGRACPGAGVRQKMNPI